jgi:predicted PurR-regulated permease PerM
MKFLLATASIIVLLAGLKAAQTLVAPFLLAVFFAMVLMPPLRFLKQKGLSDAVAVMVLSATVFLFGIGMILIFSSSLANFAERLPSYREKAVAGITLLDDWINTAIEKFEQVGESLPIIQSIQKPVTENIQEDVLEIVPKTVRENIWENTEPSEIPLLKRVKPEKERFSLFHLVQMDTLIGYIQTGVRELLNFAAVSLLIAVMAIFMLIEAAGFPAKVREAFNGRDLSNDYFEKIASDTWNYTKIKTIISLLTGLVTAIGLWFLGVEYALLWGVLMFFLNYIPNIGQMIASVPPVLLALADQGAVTAFVVTGWLILVNTVFGYGVEPRYLEKGLGISGLVVLLSLIFWGWLLGPIGMFLSAPLTMVLKIVLQNNPQTRWIAVLLSNR